MRWLAGALFLFLIFSQAHAEAQSPQYRRPTPAGEECPQGRQIRAQKTYPATMTDCEVLDADTAAENQKLQGLSPAPKNRAPIVATDPISPKPSFDCLQAKTAAARLICSDAELARLDGELGAAFRKRKAETLAPDQAKFVADQLSWIRDRNTRCELVGKNAAFIEVLSSSKPCMASMIRERIAGLAQTEQAPRVPTTTTPQERTFDHQAATGASPDKRNSTQQDDPGALTVDMSISVKSANPPMITGTTNLPDGTQVAVWLRGILKSGQQRCDFRCGFGSYTKVESGRFEISSELTEGQKLVPYLYKLELVVIPKASGQPPVVASLLGSNGEHLRGPFVRALVNHEFVPVTFPWNPDPSSEEYLTGLMIRYSQTLRITSDGAQITDRPSAEDFETLAPQKNGAEESQTTMRLPQMAGIDPPEMVYRPRPGEAYDHWTYCNWNRSGLPAAYQRICSRFDQEKALSAKRVLANASPALREYEATMTRASNNLHVAEFVSSPCNLRSMVWWRAMVDGWHLLSVSEARRLRLSDAESTAALNKIELAKKPALVFQDCEKIVNSSAMEELDEIERKFTGNYH
jgi:uncharacterized protein YecT (DUF1311 family)